MAPYDGGNIKAAASKRALTLVFKVVKSQITMMCTHTKNGRGGLEQLANCLLNTALTPEFLESRKKGSRSPK